MPNSLYNQVISKLNEMKKNKILERLVKEIEAHLDINGIDKKDFIISSRYKAEDSLKEKLERKSYKYPEQITDLAGAKIVFKDMETTMKGYEALKNNLEVIQEDNYYKDSRSTGYKSIHFNIENGNKDIIELQIKDKVNDLKQEYCHSNIYKNPTIQEEIKPEVNKHMNEFIEDYYKNISENINVNTKIKEEDEIFFSNEFKSCIEKIKNQEQDLNKSTKVKKSSLDDILKNSKDWAEKKGINNSKDIQNQGIDDKNKRKKGAKGPEL